MNITTLVHKIKTNCFEECEKLVEKHNADIRAEVIDDICENARKIKFASIDGREIFLERIYRLARQLKENSSE